MEETKITIKDIAKIAGVSRGTVDRVINNRGRVSEAKRKKIEKLVEKLGYKKNVIAQNLALNKKRKIHVIMPTHKNDQYWEMVYLGIISNKPVLVQFNINLTFFQFDINSKVDYLMKLRDACKEYPDSVLIAPVFTNETLSFLKKEDTRDIKFSAINSELDFEEMITFLGQNSFKAGEIIGKLFYKCIARKKRTIMCVTLGHDEDNAIHIQKKIAGLRAYDQEMQTNFELIMITIEQYYAPSEIARQCRIIEAKYPSVDGILFTNSRAIPFIKESAYFKNKKENLITIGFDLIEDNINLLKDGTIDFLLNERPFDQGKNSVNYIINNLIQNRDIPKKEYLPLDIVIKENYDLY